MARVREDLAGAVRALRRLMSGLGPPSPDARGLEVAIDDLVTAFAQRTGIECQVDVSLDRKLPDRTESTFYRILQEALANVERHSGASKLAMIASSHDGEVQLRIWDDGVGFDPATVGSSRDGASFGLTAMRERARLAGGRLSYESAPGRGTLVRASFPAGGVEPA